jgi:hypothetical protein
MQQARSRLVDVVAWILIVLGGIGLFIAVAQTLFVSFSGGFGFLPYSVAGVLWWGLLLWLGDGIRARRNNARLVLIVVLALAILWNLYLVVAILVGLPWPPVPQEMKMTLIAIFVFWTAVYGFLLLRFSGNKISSEFRGRDV